MSNPVTATNGAAFTGIATVKDAGLQGMITLRGDLASKTLQADSAYCEDNSTA